MPSWGQGRATKVNVLWSLISFHVSLSLLCCKHYVCRNALWPEYTIRVPQHVTDSVIQQVSPKERCPRSFEPWKVMRSWRQLSQSVCPSLLQMVIKMVFMKHRGCGFWIETVPLRRAQRGLSSAPKSTVPLSLAPVNSSMSRVQRWQESAVPLSLDTGWLFSYRGSPMSQGSLLDDVFFTKMGDDG